MPYFPTYLFDDTNPKKMLDNMHKAKVRTWYTLCALRLSTMHICFIYCMQSLVAILFYQNSRKWKLLKLQLTPVGNHSSVPFVIKNAHKRGAWLSSLHLFMRVRNHSSVPFVITIVLEKGDWPSTFQLFTRAINHSSALFVITNVRKRGSWQGTLP